MEYEYHILENNILPFIFHKIVLKNNGKGIANWHENIEILYFFKGRGKVMYNQAEYMVEPGDMIIVNRDCMHAVAADGDVEYYCLIVDSNFFRDNGINPDELSFLRQEHDDDLKKVFEKVEKLLNGEDRYYAAKIRCEVLKFILYLIDNYSAQEENKNIVPKNIAHAIVYIKKNYNQPLTVDNIVAQVGFSRAYFSREFKRITGVSIIAYLNHVRCSMARHILGSGTVSVKDAAEMCGFENLSYFSKTYKKLIGNLPSEDIGKNF